MKAEKKEIQPFIVRLPVELHEELRARSYKENRSMNELIIEALEGKQNKGRKK